MTCSCRQFCVPTGGTVGYCIGATEGGGGAQAIGAHIGAISVAVVHSGTF